VAQKRSNLKYEAEDAIAQKQQMAQGAWWCTHCDFLATLSISKDFLVCFIMIEKHVPFTSGCYQTKLMLSSFIFASNTHRVCSKRQPSVQLALVTTMLWDTRGIARCGKSISILKRYLYAVLVSHPTLL